jgi:Carboxypeptidase regulatory-like domain/TonB-dependent Receptor Plug Domain
MPKVGMSGFRRFALAGFILVGSSLCGWAQVNATISGKIEDQTGAAVGGATVTVKSLETGATRTVTTDETGNYRALSVPVGPQEVRAEKPGFRAAIRTGINLVVGQEAVVDLKLDVGQVAQEVTVAVDTPLVDTTTANVSGFVGERQIKELPLNGRSFDNLITLNPGSINYTYKSPGTVTSQGNTFSVAGRRPLENLFLLNGIEYTGSSQLSNTPGGVSGYLLGIDAVREFNVLTGTYSAEYGKRAGAQVTAVTQSGTNQLHGSVFEFLRNSALDARNIFDLDPTGAKSSPAPFRRNQYGASVGGPIKKDRLFFFGNYEGFRHRLVINSVSVVPDQEARQGRLPSQTTGVYSTVPNLNTRMLDFMSLWPQPNGPEIMVAATSPGTGFVPTGTAYSYNGPKQTINEDFGTMKGDYNPRATDSFSVSYTIDDGDNLSPLADPLFGNFIRLRSHVASIRETHIFSPHILNNFSAGFSRAGFALDSFAFATYPASLSFVSGQGPGGIVIGGGATTTGAAAITSPGPNNAAGAKNRRNLFTFSDGLQISRGQHQISIGAWFQKLQDNENTASRRLGVANFASLTTFLQGTLNPATGLQVVPTTTELAFRSWFGAWYAEDSIKLRRNLTVRAGIRHEFTTGWNEKFGRAANYVTDANGVLLTDPRTGKSAFTENKGKWLFGPRVALAWDPFGKGRTAVRGGFGIYYTLIDNLSFLLNSLPPSNGSVTFTGSLLNLVPITPGVQPPQACVPNGPTLCSIFAPQGIEAAAKTPTVNEWNLTIEQQVGANMALRVGYVGSFGYHGLLSIDPNTIPAQICSDASGCLVDSAAGTRVPQGTKYIPLLPTPSAPASTFPRPNPYLGAGFFWMTAGNSSYNALQLEVTRRLSQRLQFRGSYTWAKNLDMNSALTIAQAQNQPQMVLDRNDLRRDWGPSALTPKSQGTISAHYELPFGSATARGLGRLTGGWQLNGITTLLSGFPFTPQIGTNRSGDGNTRNPDRPDLKPSFTGPVLLKKQTQWFDPAAFSLPTVRTWGNLGRGTLLGPGLQTVDLSVMKNTAVTERVAVQFRAEFFNALNHTNLGPPNPIVFSGNSPSPSAGLITTLATDSRRIQFGLKVVY